MLLVVIPCRFLSVLIGGRQQGPERGRKGACNPAPLMVASCLFPRHRPRRGAKEGSFLRPDARGKDDKQVTPQQGGPQPTWLSR